MLGMVINFDSAYTIVSAQKKEIKTQSMGVFGLTHQKRFPIQCMICSDFRSCDPRKIPGDAVSVALHPRPGMDIRCDVEKELRTFIYFDVFVAPSSYKIKSTTLVRIPSGDN